MASKLSSWGQLWSTKVSTYLWLHFFFVTHIIIPVKFLLYVYFLYVCICTNSRYMQSAWIGQFIILNQNYSGTIHAVVVVCAASSANASCHNSTSLFFYVSSRYHLVTNINLDSSKTAQVWQQNDSCRERLLHSDQCYIWLRASFWSQPENWLRYNLLWLIFIKRPLVSQL